ncbi:HAD-IA family hydrolase [Xylanimonas sp. McL0601]|uniref:HAD-IA family hydrolase n=1 Tax=Xylanimonas sp. McL0601 TaxID=3414739 RepID=UPI003CEC307C
MTRVPAATTYRDYIWDLGGTLLDNYASSTTAFVDTLAEEGITATRAEVYRALRVSTAYAVETFAADVPGFLAEYKSAEAGELATPMLFDGAYEVLGGVVEAGGRNFLVSHRDRQVLHLLAMTGIDGLFTAVVTADDGFPRKPDPSSIRHLVERYDLTDVVAVGDRPIDVEAAVAAGIDAIYFNGGRPCPGAERAIASLRELLPIQA